MIHIWSKRNVKRTLWSIPIIIWILHTIVFYICVFINLVYPLPISFTIWSSTLRLHGYISIAWIIYYLNVLNGKVDNNDTYRNIQ